LNRIEVLKKQELYTKRMVISGGGSNSPTWCQIYSDVFNKEITKLSTEEGPSLGVCMLAAVSAGMYDSLEEASRVFIKINKKYYPDINNHKKYNELYKIYSSLYGNLKNTFSEINDFIENV